MSSRATLILIHGAWHGSWCWQRLVPHLAEHGIAVRRVDLPSVERRGAAEPDTSRSGASRIGAPESRRPSASDPSLPHRERTGRGVGLREDAAAVRAIADSIDGPVVLCGHSYGGMVISLAASRQARAAADRGQVARLIYLCAFMPEERQSLVAVGGNQHAPWIQMLDEEMTLPDLSRAGEVFYGDCDDSTQEWAISRLEPQSNTAFITPVARPAWREIPSTYIVCGRDGALPPDLQRSLFAPRAERSIELDTSHSPFLSRPEMLADALASQL